MIKLFEHNRIAYDAAVSMLAESRKAAIIHPTGTSIGKRECYVEGAGQLCRKCYFDIYIKSGNEGTN